MRTGRPKASVTLTPDERETLQSWSRVEPLRRLSPCERESCWLVQMEVPTRTWRLAFTSTAAQSAKAESPVSGGRSVFTSS